MESQPAIVRMEIIVRDKDGNIKYQGPLEFTNIEIKETNDGGNTSDSGQNGSC